MKKRIIFWDNDIGWCERFRKHLEREEILVQEAEGAEDLWRKLSNDGKEAYPEGAEAVSELMDGIMAVVLSEGQLKEEIPENWELFLKEVCALRRAPVLLVGESEEEEKEWKAFSLGVSDYVYRGKEIHICIARVLACTGKTCGWHKSSSAEWKLVKDEKNRQFYFGKACLALTPKEYIVLSCLFAQAGHVVDRKDLLRAAWGENQPQCKRVLDTIIKQLRHKLNNTCYVINSKYGNGYFLQRNMSKKRGGSP